MTSKPPSRRARAIILAPRSWPSRPGFATRMRNRFSATLLYPIRLDPVLSPSIFALNPTRITIDAELGTIDIANLTDRRVMPHSFANRTHKIRARTAGLRDALQGFFYRDAVALALHLAHALDLPFLELVLDLQRLDRNLFGDAVLVDADDRLDPLFELALIVECRLRDFELRIAAVDRLEHPAHLVDLADILHRLGFHLVGQRLDRVAAAERIDRVGDAGLFRDDLLGTQR